MTDRITMRRIPDGSGFVLDHPTVSKWEAVVFVSEGAIEVPADVAGLSRSLRREVERGHYCSETTSSPRPCGACNRARRAADALESLARRITMLEAVAKAARAFVYAGTDRETLLRRLETAVGAMAEIDQ